MTIVIIINLNYLNYYYFDSFFDFDDTFYDFSWLNIDNYFQFIHLIADKTIQYSMMNISLQYYTLYKQKNYFSYDTIILMVF